MAVRQDFQMLNDALGNLGNSFVINRQMEQQAKDRESDRDLRERMLQEQIAGRKEAAAMRNQPSFNWVSGGVKMSANSLEDFSRLVQQHPADMDEEGSTIDLTGSNEHGVQVHQRIKIPKGMPKTPETQQSVATAIKGFADMTGVKPKAAPELTPVKLPGFKGALTPGGSYVAPDAERMTDVDRAELAALNRSLSAIDAETRKLAENPSADRARALNTQRMDLEKKKTDLTGKYSKPAKTEPEAGGGGTAAAAPVAPTTAAPGGETDIVSATKAKLAAGTLTPDAVIEEANRMIASTRNPATVEKIKQRLKALGIQFTTGEQK